MRFITFGILNDDLPTGTAPAAGSPTTVNGRKEIILAAGIIQHDRSRGHVDLIIT